MNKIILTVVTIILISSYIYSQDDEQMKKINSVINEVKEKFAPDKRVAIFNIEIEKSANRFIIKGETNLAEAKMELIEQLNKEKISTADKIELLPSKDLWRKNLWSY